MKSAEEYNVVTDIEAVGTRWRFVAWGVQYTGDVGGNVFVKEAYLLIGRIGFVWYLGEVER